MVRIRIVEPNPSDAPLMLQLAAPSNMDAAPYCFRVRAKICDHLGVYVNPDRGSF